MIELFGVAAQVQRLCEKRGWKFCFIGGLALQRWGEPRVTQDVDVSLLTGFGGERPVVEELLRHFPGRIPDALEFALQNRVVLLTTPQNIGVDVALAGLPFEEEVIARSTLFEFVPGAALRTCSAEDLIVLKGFANRAKDWLDIEGVLVRQGRGGLDWSYIDRQLRPLVELKEEPEILRRLHGLREGS